jgi:hypothetical protein
VAARRIRRKNSPTDSLISDRARVIDIAFLTEVEANCQMALESWGRLQGIARARPRVGPSPRAQRRLHVWQLSCWGEVYSMVEAANRVVRLIWSAEGSKRFRRGDSRGSRPLDPNPILAKDGPVSTARAAVEHSDERILPFVRNANLRKPIAGWRVFDGKGTTDGAGDQVFRSLNTESFVCAIRSEREEVDLPLAELAVALADLKKHFPGQVAGSWVTVRGAGWLKQAYWRLQGYKADP